jgi:hypothetical protein
MSAFKLSRRQFLISGAFPVVSVRPLLSAQVIGVKGSDDSLKMLEPGKSQTLETFLSATIEWKYPVREKVLIRQKEYFWWPYRTVTLTVFSQEDGQPFVDVELPADVTCWRFPVLPAHKYLWQLVPKDEKGLRSEYRLQGWFVTGEPRIDETTDSGIRYRNPRPNAHFVHIRPLELGAYEPLSPWYEVKGFRSFPPPRFDEINDKLPKPLLDSQPGVLEAYWYCWKTLIDLWNFPPEAPDHQAVANINGTRSWGPWGSSQVWDSTFMMYFAKYGHQAYPFINQYDNAYARQHENGFICRESDSNNREVYSSNPVCCPFLLGWIELNYFQVSGDKDRLKRVFLPIVKNYEWWMTYMKRRKDGVYWLQGLTRHERERFTGDDSANYSVGLTSARAAEALALARIARIVGRQDLEQFFVSEHRNIGEIVNNRFWDAQHGIYNDRCDPDHMIARYRNPALAGQFVTEIKPGVIDKSVWIFTPLFGEIVPRDRLASVVQELRNPASFNRSTGIPNVSADSGAYNGPVSSNNGVWPPPMCIIQEGLKVSGEIGLAHDLAEKYFNSVIAAFSVEKTIKECILADKLQFSGAPEFVGWGGIGPIANLIEYILGFDISAPEKTITWRITRTDRHGLQNLKFSGFDVELICEARQTADEPCRVTVNSGGAFTLAVILHGKTLENRIEKGTVTLQLG